MIRLISNATLWNLHIAQGRTDAVQAWVRANGIEPNTVPVDADMTIEDGQDGRVIRYAAYALSDSGAKLADPLRNGASRREERVVPLVVEPPADWPVYAAPPRKEALDS